MSKTDPFLDILGMQVRDRILGVTGVAASVSFDLYGCVQVAITRPLDENGKIRDTHWYDIQRLEITGARVMPLPTFALQATQAGPAGPADKPAPGF